MTKLEYGDKRDYRKIDIYVNNVYTGTTTWAKSLKIAKEEYIKQALIKYPEMVKVYYSYKQ